MTLVEGLRWAQKQSGGTLAGLVVRYARRSVQHAPATLKLAALLIEAHLAGIRLEGGGFVAYCFGGELEIHAVTTRREYRRGLRANAGPTADDDGDGRRTSDDGGAGIMPSESVRGDGMHV